MSKSKKAPEWPSLSKFMMMRRHSKLVAQRGATDTQVKELTKERDSMKDNTKLSGRGCDREDKALYVAEGALRSINRKIASNEKELGYPQR